jgi:DNA-binding IclR family transcriptional regulator
MDIDKKQVQSISRAAEILACISNGANSITDIASSCKLSKSTAHRLLRALVESNLVTRDPVKRQYYLGYLVTRLIYRPEIINEYLVICANEELKRLADITGETVSFGLMIALRYVNLLSIPSKYDLRVIEEPKKAGSIYTGASGRVLLSQLSNKELKTAIKCIRLYPVGDFTSVDKEQLTEQIKLIRQQGYEVSSGEQSSGVMCMAASIKNYELPVVLYILGPENRMKLRTSEYLDSLINSAGRISHNIEQVFGK